MTIDATGELDKKLDTIIGILKQMLAIELYKLGMPQTEIAKRLHIATKGVNEMLKGLKKEK